MNDDNQGIYNNINKFINDSLNINNLFIYSLILITILYILTTYNKTINIINIENVRIGLLILISFITYNNIYIGFIMTLIILTIMQDVTYKNIDNQIYTINKHLYP